jgi:hypothetical protein
MRKGTLEEQKYMLLLLIPPLASVTSIHAPTTYPFVTVAVFAVPVQSVVA